MNEDGEGQNENNTKDDNEEKYVLFHMLRESISNFIHENKQNIIITIILVLCISLVLFFCSSVFDNIKLYGYYKSGNSKRLESYIKSNYKETN